MIQERHKPTFLRKLYPNTKLWMSLGMTVVIIAMANTWFSMAVILVSIIWIFREKFYLEFKVVALAILVMALSMFLVNGTLNPVNDYTKDPVYSLTLPFITVRFFREGLNYALVYFRRIAPLMAWLFLLFRTMNMTDLGIAMNEGGLPYRASFIFITTFQTFPQLSKEMHQIMDAQRARGLETEGNLWRRLGSFIPIMVPVVANSIMKVQQQAIALETKGFNAPGAKTVYRDLEKTRWDYFLKWFCIIASIGSIIYRIIVNFFLKSGV